LSSINSQKIYLLNEEYENIKQRAIQVLGKYLEYPDLITFNDLDRSVTFATERLIPTNLTNRPCVMLLFSNPHPHSVHQGMFLSPNRKGRQNLFWPVMEEAGWITIAEKNPNPNQLADICLEVKYRGPFELIFQCYYDFPTNFPGEIIKIFGKEYFRQVIELEAINEFKKTIQGTSPQAVVTFNKEIFNLISEDHIERYIDRLKIGELIQSQIDGIERNVPTFLTFPTGWRYHKRFRQLRKTSLDSIKTTIYSRSNVPECNN